LDVVEVKVQTDGVGNVETVDVGGDAVFAQSRGDAADRRLDGDAEPVGHQAGGDLGQVDNAVDVGLVERFRRHGRDADGDVNEGLRSPLCGHDDVADVCGLIGFAGLGYRGRWKLRRLGARRQCRESCAGQRDR